MSSALEQAANKLLAESLKDDGTRDDGLIERLSGAIQTLQGTAGGHVFLPQMHIIQSRVVGASVALIKCPYQQSQTTDTARTRSELANAKRLRCAEFAHSHCLQGCPARGRLCCIMPWVCTQFVQASVRTAYIMLSLEVLS